MGTNKIDICVAHAQAFSVFRKYWPDGVPLRPKLVVYSNITVNI